MNWCYFDAYGCPPPKLTTNNFVWRKRKSVFFWLWYPSKREILCSYLFMFYSLPESKKNGLWISFITFVVYVKKDTKKNKIWWKCRIPIRRQKCLKESRTVSGGHWKLEEFCRIKRKKMYEIKKLTRSVNDLILIKKCVELKHIFWETSQISCWTSQNKFSRNNKRWREHVKSDRFFDVPYNCFN